MAKENHCLFTTEKINDRLYRFADASNTLIYLLIGSEKAAVIDTGYGLGDLIGHVRKYTDKPLICLLTHAHRDHAMGAGAFGEAWMNFADLEKYASDSPLENRKAGMEIADLDHGNGLYAFAEESDWQPILPIEKLHNLNDGDVFDLGDRHVVTCLLPGHSDGSAMFFFPEERMLLMGDACNMHIRIWTDLATYRDQLWDLRKKLVGKVDRLLISHEGGDTPFHTIEMVADLADRVIRREVSGVPFKGKNPIFLTRNMLRVTHNYTENQTVYEVELIYDEGLCAPPKDSWKNEDPRIQDALNRFLDYTTVWCDEDFRPADFAASGYGQEIGRLQTLAYQWENPMDPAELEWYQNIGVKKEMFETDHFYTRWALLSPLELETDRKYPLIFVNHGGGNYLESEEWSTGFNQMAGTEKFFAAYLQNTNTDNILRILDLLIEKYPIDSERVYVTGFSQGGGKTTDCAFRAPERFAAHAPCGNDIYRYLDRFGVPYSEEQHQALKEAFLPFMQVVGCNEHSRIVPLNHWYAPVRHRAGVVGDFHTFPPIGKEEDPTRPNDPTAKGGSVNPGSADPRLWMVEQLNKRLSLLDIPPRDVETCLRYEEEPDNELHKVLGFYGDKERTELYYGYKHYCISLNSSKGMEAFRYVAVENHCHWPPLMMGTLVWDFFRHYRRDTSTGEIIYME